MYLFVFIFFSFCSQFFLFCSLLCYFTSRLQVFLQRLVVRNLSILFICTLFWTPTTLSCKQDSIGVFIYTKASIWGCTVAINNTPLLHSLILLCQYCTPRTSLSLLYFSSALSPFSHCFLHHCPAVSFSLYFFPCHLFCQRCRKQHL